MHVTKKPSSAEFSIDFIGTPQPSGMSITPDGGDAWLQVVTKTGDRHNKVVWQSRQAFSIRFGQIDDPTQPLKPGKHLGNEKPDWNDASGPDKDGLWKYTLTLSQGNGRTPETVAAKYFVKHVASGQVFDPVIIVGR
jgi:hypothetical protein